jgi:hypothetical protein
MDFGVEGVFDEVDGTSCSSRSPLSLECTKEAQTREDGR